MSGTNWIIRGARILDPARNKDVIGDLCSIGGRIAEEIPGGVEFEEISGDGIFAVPGLIDMHVHFREPGGEEAETIATGTYAAFKGGFSTLVTMPNTVPPVDSPEAVLYQISAKVYPKGKIKILPSACCTRGRAGQEIADLEALSEAGAIAFTDDGSMVEDDALMEEIMTRAAKLGKPVMEHAVISGIAKNGVIRESENLRNLDLKVFPDEAETVAVERDIELCRKTGCSVHLQHLSSGESVDLIRQAQREGLPVTAEVTPHHLMLAVEDIPGNDANWKMNPPLGTRKDLEKLRAGVLEGVISCFATDHAPHAARFKKLGFTRAPFGVTGLETAVAATWTAMVVESGMEPLEWARRWLCGPADVLGIERPSFTPGNAVAATLFNTNPWHIQSADLSSKSLNNPFVGRTLVGRVLTMLG